MFAREQEHLGDRIAAYVDAVLSPEEEYKVEMHLMVCQHCRHAVDQERVLIARLRAISFNPGGHQQMMASLLSLAADDGLGGGRAFGPMSADLSRPTLAVVTTGAPPQYQSARRSMACALAAVAGCVGVALVATSAAAGSPLRNNQQPVSHVALVRDAGAPAEATPAVVATRRSSVLGSLTSVTQVSCRDAP